jgi:hypothetical protein
LKGSVEMANWEKAKQSGIAQVDLEEGKKRG